ncbi:MAG TPA: VCBS repeat-containing protein [Opitutaceae bacterium]|nr:VCBS repeat-containing protein [Opitutaceae bacterium]
MTWSHGCFWFAALASAGFAAAPMREPPGGAPWARHVIDNTGAGADGTKLGDINGDGLPDITTGWEEDGSTRVYLNPGRAAVHQPWPKVIVGITPSAEDAMFVDLDHDGAVDVVTCTEGSTRRVFVQWAPKEAARRLDPAAWRQDVFPATDAKTRWMFAAAAQLDGRHGVDLLLGGREGNGTARSTLGWLEAPAAAREVGSWRWHPLIEMGWVMTLQLEDMDGDGDADILYSDRTGPTRGVYWLQNPGPAGVAAGAEWKKHVVGATSAHQIMFLYSGDVDGDGLRDIAVGIERAKVDTKNPDEHSQVLWLRRENRSGDQWTEHTLPVPGNTGNVKGIAIGDLDGDGRADLAVSCENATGDRRGVYWLRQPARGAISPWSAFDISGPPGIKFDLIQLLDLDGDGDLDVLTSEEREGGAGLGVVWYQNPARPEVR